MINKINSASLNFSKIVISVLILNLIVFGLVTLATPVELLVQYIPDDAFYYLTLSRNFADLGTWTFDSGISNTSGFHLLFAYFLTAIFKVFQPSPVNFVLGGLILSMAFALVFIWLVTYLGFKQGNILFLFFLAFVISSKNFIYNTISITEWSLNLLFTLLYCVYYFYRSKNEITLKNHVILFTIGFFGSLARTDFGLLCFSITFATFLLFASKMAPQKWVVFSLVGLLGAFMGVVAMFGHNYLFTMEILQSSARMKAFWAQLEDRNFLAVFALTLELLGIFGLLVVTFLSVKFSALILFKFRTQTNYRLNVFFSDLIRLTKAHLSTDQILMIISSIGCLVGYTIFYSRNSAIQPWYSSNLIVPFLLFFYGTSNLIVAKLSINSRVFLMLLMLTVIIIRGFNLYPISARNSPWPHQELMFKAGVYLNKNEDNLPIGKIGSWNAGIIGYFQGGQIINLDGLVNNDIYSFAIKNELPTYLENQNITYIIDFEKMFTSEYRRMRGGYDKVDFLSRLSPLTTFSSENPDSSWVNLTLYQILEHP